MAIGLHGITVTLLNRIDNGVDEFNNPKRAWTRYTIDNVLVGQPSTDELTEAINLHGKRLVYTLGIPRTDDHDWEDSIVIFFDHAFFTFGNVLQGIDDLIPLDWNRNVMVENYNWEPLQFETFIITEDGQVITTEDDEALET